MEKAESQTPENEVLRQEVDKRLTKTLADFRLPAYNVLVSAIKEAKRAGVDVSDVEAQMPELEKKCMYQNV